MKSLQQRSTFAFVLILMPLVFSFAVALDIFIPILPKVQQVFNASAKEIQLTLSAFMFTMGLGQLIFGPLSDAFGRRKTLFLSAAFFTVGSILCALAMHVYVLIIARVIQAAGACGMIATATAIVRDLYVGNQAGKIYSYLNGAVSFSPLFAPLIGGYLDKWFNWHAPFVFLVGLGLFGFYIIFCFIHETQNLEARLPLNFSIFKRYWQILHNRQFLTYILVSASCLSVAFTFFAISPFVLINLLHVPSHIFGYYFGAVGLFCILSNLLGAHLSGRIGVFKTSSLGVGLIFAAGIIMATWYYLFGLSIASFIGPMLLMATGLCIGIGSSAAGALAPFGEMAGSASALLGCAQFAGAALVGALATSRIIHSNLPLAFTAITLGLLNGLALWTLRRKNLTS